MGAIGSTMVNKYCSITVQAEFLEDAVIFYYTAYSRSMQSFAVKSSEEWLPFTEQDYEHR